MKRRLIALLLTAATLLGLLGGLSGCADNTASAITQGDWLAKINEAFGMYSHQQQEPYIPGITAGSPYFTTVQIAVEWDVIEAGKSFKTDAAVTNAFVATTLVGAARLGGEAMTEDEKVAVAIDKGILGLNGSGRFDKKGKTEYDTAMMALGIAVELWAGKIFEETKLRYSGKGGVVDLMQQGLAADQFYVDPVANRITLPQDYGAELETGSIFILPASESNATATAYQVERAETSGGITQITYADKELAVEDVFDELFLQTTYAADLTGLPILDGNGNPVVWETDGGGVLSTASEAVSGPTLLDLADRQDGSYTQLSVPSSGSLNFKVSGFEVSGKITGNSLSFSVKGSLPERVPGLKLQVTTGFEISNITPTVEYDYSWFTLHALTAKVRYDTKKTFGVEAKYTKSGAFFNETLDSSSLWDAVLRDTSYLGSFKDQVNTINICTIPLASAGVASLNLDVRVEVSITGSIELVISTTETYGIEYVNSNLRYINQKHDSASLAMKAKIEATIYLGASVKALGITLIGLGFKFGLGFEYQFTLWLLDKNEELVGTTGVNISDDVMEVYTQELRSASLDFRLDVCHDLTLYGILKFSVDSNTLAGGIIKGLITDRGSGGAKGELEISILSKDNCTITHIGSLQVSGHREDGHWVDACTRKYDGAEEEDDVPEESSASNEMQLIGLSQYFLPLEAGSVATIAVTEIPSGYGMEEIVFTTENPAIATVNSSGEVTGVAEGTTTLQVSTPDGKFIAQCAIAVTARRADMKGDFLVMPLWGEHI